VNRMFKREACYRGYKIRADTRGSFWAVSVQPLTPDLPILFRNSFTSPGSQDPIEEAERRIDRVLSV
jgi:hypothetical protein